MIRRQMQQTRESLTEKLETLEQQVVQTVQDATSAVSETVESVKEAVQETVHTVKGSVENTVHSVKSTFDLHHQTHEHPWIMMSGATAAGFLAGWLFGGREQSRFSRATGVPPPSRGGYREERGGYREEGRLAAAPPMMASHPPSRAAAASEAPTWSHRLHHLFGDEIDKLKGVALGTLFGVIRDVVSEIVPKQIEPRVADIIDNVTTKLGGEPVKESLLHCSNGRHGDGK
jgi:ElaB/YqjD/DUF883 family membrane-anchored ribosome-binding protein